METLKKNKMAVRLFLISYFCTLAIQLQQGMLLPRRPLQPQPLLFLQPVLFFQQHQLTFRRRLHGIPRPTDAIYVTKNDNLLTSVIGKHELNYMSFYLSADEEQTTWVSLERDRRVTQNYE